MPPHDRSAERRSRQSARQSPPSAPPDLWVGIAQSLSANGDHRRRTAKTAEHVALAIVHDIVAGGMATGDRLPSEAAMLTQYRVSRSSLREGLRLLEVQGLITLKPGPVGGAVVGTVDPRNLARISTLYLHLGGAHYRELFNFTVEGLQSARTALSGPIVTATISSTSIAPPSRICIAASMACVS